MSAKSKEIDKYIKDAKPFARPILNQLRKIIHQECPLAEEKIKWGFPAFLYNGSILCHMAAFNQHCSFGFWLGDQMKDRHRVFIKNEGKKGMGSFGKIGATTDLPSATVIKEYLREAMKLADSGVKLKRKVPAAGKKEVLIPPDLNKMLKAKKSLYENFSKMSPSHRKEYVEWITEAKTDKTRIKRLNTAVEWISENKPRNWKYMKKY
jgi:uncharacterized protein YdeI (YjbR/CyaY-like superfamily)